MRPEGAQGLPFAERPPPTLRPLHRRLRAWLALYALLLGASTLWRATRAGDPPVPAELATLELPALRGTRSAAGTLRLAYSDTGSGDAVLLLHGSPGSRRDFARLLPELEGRRLIVPDLPGFGASGRDVPDYSFRAHAAYVARLLAALGIERAHVVGFSMGGAVALELADQAPERVRSLTLLSGLGVQELEWLGDHHLNRALHALQLALLWSARELVPHFGTLDHTVLGVPYARNFFDSDQRPLRGILERLRVPLLIVHGARDALVPLAAAREHARLVPHSRLEPFEDAGHFLLFQRPSDVARVLNGFFDEVEAGRAPSRADATPERLARAGEPFDIRSSAPLPSFARHAVLALLALATLVSEDLACIGAGALAAQGRIGLLEASLACFVGIYVGDILLFLAGRLVGRRALRVAPLRWFLAEVDVERAARWFESRGAAAIFLSRFLPGTRLPTYFAAGALGASFWRFALYFALAAGLWTPILVWIASRLGGELLHNVELFRDALPLALLTLVVSVLVLLKLLLPLATWRGRRTLVGRYRRWRHWEFWPRWLFYPPLVLYVAFLGLVRHRRPTLFTAVNPGIPLGGFIDESKAAILGQLTAADPARLRVATWEALPAGLDSAERLARVRAFAAREGLTWPLVLKPDAGQRGSGVLVARDEDALRTYLEQTHEALVVQEFAPGVEYGLFYARRPGEARGRILSITEKRLAQVIGDGVSTLERLILADARAVALWRYYCAKNAARLGEVPAAGECVVLGDLGTHARGAIFLDATGEVTPELERIVDDFTRSFEGFCFGRYDVRVPDAEHLRRGEGLLAIELNGVTSEMTSIYDRRHGLLFAWRTLAAQWRLAFEIGAANAARGAAVAGPLDLMRAMLSYRAHSRRRLGG